MVVNGWVLMAANGTPAQVGGTYLDFRGDPSVLTGGAPPHKSSSTGKVYLTSPFGGNAREFFPSVVGLRWEAYE